MRRSITAIALLVSFVAMATSGMLMFVVERPSFTLRMHPVHKFFGLVMIAAAISHLSLNARALVAHLKQRAPALVGAVLVAALVLTYALVILRSVPSEQANLLDEAARQLESSSDAGK